MCLPPHLIIDHPSHQAVIHDLHVYFSSFEHVMDGHAPADVAAVQFIDSSERLSIADLCTLAMSHAINCSTERGRQSYQHGSRHC